MKKITLLMIIAFTITLQGQNKLLSSVSQYLDFISVWQNSQGSNYEYDNNNNLISETRLNFSQSNAWKIASKDSYTYNASNKVTEQIYQNWNTTTNKLENQERRLNTYTNGNRTECIFQTWNTSGSSWVYTEKQVLTFNSNNKPDGGLFYDWDGSQWVLANRPTVTYNANNKVTSLLFEKWDGSQWINANKRLFSYNANNHLTVDKGASWDDFNAIWKVTDQRDYVFDANGNITSETDTDASDKNKNYKIENTFDTSSLMSSFINPFNDKDGLDYFDHDPFFVNKALSYNEFSYNISTSMYNIRNKTTFNYNNTIVLGTEKLEIAKATVTVFPNPTKDFLSIQNTSNNPIDKVIVTDISGKTILQQNQNTNQVDVQNLVKGMYFIQVYSGIEKFTSKFIKE